MADRGSSKDGSGLWLAGVFAVCMAVMLTRQILALFQALPGHDQSWYLAGGSRVLAGQALYGPQFYDTNPPLIVWFSAVPVLLGRMLQVSAIAGLRMTVLLMACGSTLWCCRLLRLEKGRALQRLMLVIALSIPAMLFTLNLYDFGQREQLLYLLVLPYLMAASLPAGLLGSTEAVLVGVAAGAAVCLKPQQALILVAVEILLLMERRSVRRLAGPTMFAVMATGLLYLFLIRLWTPQFLQVTLPELVNCYWAFGSESALHLALARRGPITVLALGLLAAIVRFRSRLRLANTAAVLVVASLGASAAFCLQHTGWVYQEFPAKALLGLGFVVAAWDGGWLVLEGLREELRPKAQVAVAVLLVIGFAAAVRVQRQRNLHLGAPDRGDVDALLAGEPAGTKVANYSVSGVSISDVKAQQLEWGSGLLHLWMLPAIVQNERGPRGGGAPFKRLSSAVLSSLEEQQRTMVAEDLEVWRPDLVLVEQCTSAHPCVALGNAPFDTVAWLSGSERFLADWRQYRLRAGNGSYAAYERMR